jgi:uncharacterized SAM-binding protein YcdF (DUF218 family)
MKVLGWIIGLLLLVVAIISAISWFLSPDELSQCGDTPDDTGNCARADAIVAISGGDTQARTAEAINLYQQGWADVLIFSGAAYDKDSPSNAVTMKAQALEAGIPEQAIAIEESARDTSENAALTLPIASERGVKRVILVTSGYHQRRAGMDFRRVFGDVTVINHSVEEDRHWSKTWWLTPRGWYLAVSELVKIIFLWLSSV